jgi:hypothetical protein
MSGEKDTAVYRAELARQQPSPEIYLASAIVDGSPPVWPGSIVIKKPEDARRAVAEIKSSGADFIKVYTRVPHDAYFALAGLVLLRADPLADIHNTTQIQAVWLRGKYFDQAALAQLLETAKQAAKH